MKRRRSSPDWGAERIRSALEGMGYDVEILPPVPELSEGALDAFKEVGERSFDVFVDRSGAFECEVVDVIPNEVEEEESPGVGSWTIGSGTERSMEVVGVLVDPAGIVEIAGRLDGWAGRHLGPAGPAAPSPTPNVRARSLLQRPPGERDREPRDRR